MTGAATCVSRCGTSPSPRTGLVRPGEAQPQIASPGPIGRPKVILTSPAPSPGRAQAAPRVHSLYGFSGSRPLFGVTMLRANSWLHTFGDTAM